MAANQRERQAVIVVAIRSLFTALSQWGQSTQDYIADYLESAVERFLAVIQEPGLPSECHGTLAIASRLHAAWVAWKEEAERTQILHNLPEPEFWAAIADLPTALVTLAYPPPPQLEPLASLVEQLKTSPGGRGQICRMYGFFDEHGNPQPQWIDEELANPGSRTGPESGWEHPIQKRRKAQFADDLADMEEILEVVAGKCERLEKHCPESIEQLVAQGVYLPQICRMKRMTVEQVLALCEERNLPAPAQSPNILSGRSALDKELTAEQSERFEREQNWRKAGRKAPPGVREKAQEQRQESAGGTLLADAPIEMESLGSGAPESIERQIVRLHQGGQTPAAIVKELRAVGVSKAKVEATIKRFDENPELFVVG